MSSVDLTRDPTPSLRPETEPERLARIEREEALVAQAEADIDAGRGIELDDLMSWFKALEHDADAPIPLPRDAVVTS